MSRIPDHLKDRYLVIKIGGEIAEQGDILVSLVQDLIALHRQGVRVILCHGGGPQISRALKESGIEAKFIRGHRVTDSDSRKVIIERLLGEINPKLVAAVQQEGGRAVGLSGFDGGLYQVKPRDKELGWVGDIVSVNVGLIKSLSEGGYIPVVACLGIDQSRCIQRLQLFQPYET